MKFVRILTFSFLFAISVAPMWAHDFAIDPTFNSGSNSFNTVRDVYVYPDGRLLVTGTACSPCGPTIRRLNPDGSHDPTFNLHLNPSPGSTYFERIKPLDNGQFLITGDFSVGSTRSSFVRINGDGSIDPTMTPLFVGVAVIEPTFDNKFMVCNRGVVNGENYDTAFRLNSDGTPDPSFRITSVEANCGGISVMANGKFLIATSTINTPIKPLHKFNSDGSLDTSFDADLPVSGRVNGLELLPDGKMILSSYIPGIGDDKVVRLTETGAIDMETTSCIGGIFLPKPNGDVYTTNCKKWATSFAPSVTFARLFSDGTVDPTLDELHIAAGLRGFRDAGNGRMYIFGDFNGIGGVFSPGTSKIVRLEPNTSPTKAKYDFDGDGRSDLAVFRPSDRFWYIFKSSDGIAYQLFGLADDALAAGHYDDDGRTDIGIFRDGTLHAYSPMFAHRQILIGQTGDKPLPGNFEDYYPNIGDFMVRGLRSGSVTWIFRDGVTAPLYVAASYSFTLPGELATDTPVVGDFNGDSRDEAGYFRDGLWYTSDYKFMQEPQTIQWGMAGDIPVPDDYDGDRQTDYAIFRPSTGVWWIRLSSGGFFIVQFGQEGDIPVPADYDGDGKVDIAIFRGGQWWQYRSSTWSVHVEQWGMAGDKPIPAQHQ